MSQHDEIELSLDADALAMLSCSVRGYRLGAPANVLLEVVQEGLDRLLLQVVKAKRVTLLAAPAAAPALPEPVQTCVMDYPTAWAFIREQHPDPSEHDPRCSWVQAKGGILCDCHIINTEYERRRKLLAAPTPAQADPKTFLCSCGQRTILADADPE